MFLFSNYVHAVVLEDMPPKTLDNLTVCYYVGSFDPLHKGHEAIVNIVLENKLCDYVLIYPAWGGDSHKIRTDIAIRLDMLFAVFRANEHVIVTRLNPYALQNYFMANNNFSILGVIGEDVANWLLENQEHLSTFMEGNEIPLALRNHTYGGNMVFPAKGFIVIKRELGNNQIDISSYLGKRPIIASLSIEPRVAGFSSSLFKKSLKGKEKPNFMVSEPVMRIILDHNLYQCIN